MEIMKTPKNKLDLNKIIIASSGNIYRKKWILTVFLTIILILWNINSIIDPEKDSITNRLFFCLIKKLHFQLEFCLCNIDMKIN